MKRSLKISLAVSTAGILSLTQLNNALCADPAASAKPKKEAVAAADEHAHSGLIKWEHWSDEAFARAKKENKLLILDLEAVWCHWCHVMDERTYSNPEVAKLLSDHFICLKVDQDSRPDISNRYEEYGWPATIFFGSDGKELAKRQGFIRPDKMIALLTELVKNPVPEEDAKEPTAISYSNDTALPKELREELLKKHIAGYDDKMGAWGFEHKFLDWDSVEFALSRAKEGNAQASTMAKQTLIGQLNLIDPVWGGVYQYSTDGDWQHKHFEKIMQFQGENLKVYSMGYMYFKDPRFLKAGQDIERYLRTFLMSPEGAFYTSQDADVKKGQHSEGYFLLSDAARRKQGIPRIDKHVYSRENGWAINGVAWLYMASGDKKYLDEAIKAAEWIIKNRSLPGGGFSHDAKDPAGPYLGDSLYMGRAFLSLYQATGDRKWLTRAEQAGDFIARHFHPEEGKAGYLISDPLTAGMHKPAPLLEENIALCRFANLLYQYSGKKDYRGIAENCMKYLATPQIARLRRILVAGTLLCDRELTSEPAHVTIVGGKADPQALALFKAANRYPVSYKRVEWFDRKEGPLPNSDVELPEMPKAAAFGCANQRCSRPVFTPEEVPALIDRVTKSK